MSDKTIKLAMFALGATAGAFVVWKVLSKKKDELVEYDDIDDIDIIVDEDLEASSTADENKIVDYNSAMKKAGYDTRTKDVYDRDKNERACNPFVISPDEFNTRDGYEAISLIYYADKVLADDNDELVDIVEVVGEDALTHFGEYEADSVFVRNMLLRCDYEILLDERTYASVLEGKPGGHKK